MKLRLVILPPPKINRLSAKLAERLSRNFPHKFIVDNRYLLPHVTLFSLQVHRKLLPGFLTRLSAHLRNQKSFRLQIEGFQIYASIGGGWFSLKITPVDRFQAFCRPLKAFVKKNRAQAQRYPVSPHITLTKFTNHAYAASTKRTATPFPATVFRVDTIGVCLSDKYGQVYKILKKIKLRTT